jgi:hypothetical protein
MARKHLAIFIMSLMVVSPCLGMHALMRSRQARRIEFQVKKRPEHTILFRNKLLDQDVKDPSEVKVKLTVTLPGGKGRKAIQLPFALKEYRFPLFYDQALFLDVRLHGKGSISSLNRVIISKRTDSVILTRDGQGNPALITTRIYEDF